MEYNESRIRKMYRVGRQVWLRGSVWTPCVVERIERQCVVVKTAGVSCGFDVHVHFSVVGRDLRVNMPRVDGF